MIDFDSMNSKKICILCRHPDKIKSLVSFLKSKELEVFVSKNSADYFQSLTTNKPGFAMISNDMNVSLGKVFPHFIQRKFKIPVLLFNDDNHKPMAGQDQPSLHNPLAPVKTLREINPEKVHAEIMSFKNNYEQALGNQGQDKNSTVLDELHQKRLQRQSNLVNQFRNQIADHKNGSAVANLIENAFEDPLESASLLHINTVKIQDGDGNGCFLFATKADGTIDPQNVRAEIAKTLSMINENDLEIETLGSQITQEFYSQLKAKANSNHVGQINNENVCLMYYENAKVSNLDEITLSKHGYLVPVDDWITSMPLTFNASIWFVLNDRKILYLRKGNRFPEQKVSRFKTRAQKILVHVTEFHLFQQMADLAQMAA